MRSSTEKTEEVATDVETAVHGITYEEFHDSVVSDAYDAVYICTSNAFHLDYAETAAELGKHVLSEKPMKPTVEGAREMVNVCDAHDIDLIRHSLSVAMGPYARDQI